MAKKRGKPSGTKRTTPGTTKRAARPQAPARPTAAKPAQAARPAPPARASRGAATAAPSLLEQAERLRDVVHRSKLSAPDPWAYTAKARGWAERAQQLVDQLALRGESAALKGALETLAAEVERDRDFLAARRLL